MNKGSIQKILQTKNLSYKQAIEIQNRLRKQVRLKNSFKKIRFIAGCDLAFTKDGKKAIGGVIVYSWPDLNEIERQFYIGKVVFPYIPGLLSFREAPVLMNTIAKLKVKPDLFIFDGQGIAHPRRVGLATHMGLLLNKPTIGCAKSRLIGKYREPGKKRGSISPLFSNEGMKIGNVVRTRDHVRPIFVSPGHRIDFQTAIRIIMDCVDGFRIPKPTREADHWVAQVKRRGL